MNDDLTKLSIKIEMLLDVLLELARQRAALSLLDMVHEEYFMDGVFVGLDIANAPVDLECVEAVYRMYISEWSEWQQEQKEAANRRAQA